MNFNIFGVFQKMNIFGVLRFCGYFFGDHHNIGLYLGVISMHFRVFFKVKVQKGGYFLVVIISNCFGCLKFQIFFCGER